MTDIYKNCVDFLQVKNADVTVEKVELHSVEEFYPNYVILPWLWLSGKWAIIQQYHD